MNVFNYKTPTDRRLDCVQRMLFNHVMDLKKRRTEVDDIYLQHFYKLLGLRKTMLSEILSKLEMHEKVIVKFDLKDEGGKRSTQFKVFQADEYKWEDLLCGMKGNQSGMCLCFIIDGDIDNATWYFASEKQLKGSVLSKVLDIEL